MSDELKEIYLKINMLESEVGDLRNGYLTINKSYSEALKSLKDLTEHACEAAKRSAQSAIRASEAAKNAAVAATEAAATSIVKAADAAAATPKATLARRANLSKSPPSFLMSF